MPKLIGTGLNQVPTNSMLGGMAYQSPDNVAIKNLDLQSLSQYNSTIPSNAIDVFVYDTRKDSDGGAWRKRTQHTSWYNETLNTTTRGSRREFPAVAVIVVSTSPNRVTVYDGDDPDMPMWMVFTSNVNQYGAIFNNRSVVSVVAINGSIIWADSTDSVIDVSFIKDNYTSTATSGSWNSMRNILNRNPTDTNNLWTNYNSSRALIAYPLNDLAITVLPNAPFDTSTGLPVPTVAVACGPTNTTGGLSVINDNGTVSSVSFTSVTFYTVRWIDNTRIYAGSIHINAVIGFRHYVINYPSMNVERIEGYSYEDTGLNWSTGGASGSGGGIYPNKFATIKDGFAIGYDQVYNGLNLINYDPNPNAGLFAYIKTNYNTGWMHGDIKGAWLSDTSTASVTGTELITNGTFTTNTSGWTARNGGTISVVSGALRVNANGNAYGGVAQTITTTAGKQYVLTLTSGTITNATQFNVIARDYYASTNLAVSAVSANSNNIVIYFTAINTLTDIIFESINNTSSIFDVDNVSVRITELDRSVNNKGLAVYGTLTKTAVATNADLVGYTGFSATNYLVQPYNSALAVGTGDICFMGWAKTSVSGNYELIFSYGFNLTNEFRVFFLNDGTGILLQATNNAFAGSYDSVATAIAGLRNWTHLTIIRKNLTNYQVYVNGVLVQNSTLAYFTTFSNTGNNSSFYFGNTSGGFTTNQSFSLWRISTSVPSSEQILKIYNDEKALFQENSKAVLYGSSDAVTAIAYDDTTKLLHVGTSSGRSDFQGLERINNTTTAVTTAISASNGLIAEQ